MTNIKTKILYNCIVRQNIVSGYSFLFFVIAIFILMIILAVMRYKTKTACPELSFFLGTSIFGFGMSLFIFCVEFLPRILNPEFYAIVFMSKQLH